MSGSYDVANAAQLNAAIAAIDAASATAPAGSSYEINITTDIVMSSAITPIDLASGTSLTITGNVPSSGNTSAVVEGNGTRGFVVEAGAVTLDSLTISVMSATGGRGGSGASPGGGGAGLGGGLFVAAGASVLLTNDSFAENSASGGGGGAKTGTGTGAGGSGEPGGFGTGGAGGAAGGFGGGGGYGAAGGFGAGSNAGGGLAAGGNIFVQAGGSLNFGSGTAGAGSLTASGGGQTYGNNIFIQGNTTITLGNVTLTGVIADQSGSGGTGANAGAGGVVVDGATTLAAVNTYTGGTEILGGTLTLGNASGAGSGAIGFGSGELIIKAGDTPANVITGFGLGDTIDLAKVGLEKSSSLSSGNVLSLTGGSSPVSLNFDPTQNFGADGFVLQPDGAGGTLVTLTQTGFTVTSEAQLNTVLSEIDSGGIYVAPHTAYTITLGAGFTLNTDLDAVNLLKGDSLTINGGGKTINGGGQYRGIFVYGGSVAINNLTITDAVAAGGAGGAGLTPGGGGAGLGGGLFVGAGTSVSLNNVNFTADAAVGGAAGALGASAEGGGGGLGGAGGAGANGRAGGGGGVGTGAVGGTAGPPATTGGNGILLGAGGAQAGTGTNGGGGAGGNGGGGGYAGQYSGSGRDPRSSPGAAGAGGVLGAADFGGGAGADTTAGFGGGGAAPDGTVNGTVNPNSGAGGWGGGGAGGAAGGFGAGGTGAAAGGGLGAGGGVFVQQGGSLTISGGSISGNSATGGAGVGGAGNGSAYGAGIFFQGGNTLKLTPAAGQTVSLTDVIADQPGSGGGSGAASLLVNGAGGVLLGATNTYTGGTTIDAGTLSLQAPGAAGTGAITFAYGALAALVVGAGDTPANVIKFFLPGQTIDLQGIGTATSAILRPGNKLLVSGGTTSVTLQLFTGQNFTGETFTTTPDGTGGTIVTPVTVNNDHPPSISGAAVGGNDHTPFNPLKGVKIADLDAGQTETATIKLSSVNNGVLSNLSGGTYNATTGIYTVSGSAAAVTAAIDALVFTPTEYQTTPGSSVTTGFNLSVTDGTMIAASNFSVAVAALNDAPVISGYNNWQDAYWNVAFTPFTGTLITDPDHNATETVTLSGAAPGTFSLPNPVDGISLTANSDGTYTLTAGSPAAESAALDQVLFTPATNNPALGFTINSLGISVSDGIAPAVTAGVNVSAGLPIVTGAVTGQTVVDTSTIDPFSTVQITDSAYFTSEAVTISLTDGFGNLLPGNGTLSGPGLTEAAPGIYTLAAGTPAQVTSAIDQLVFTPTPNQVPPGQSVTTDFVISVFDGATTSDWYGATVIATAPVAAAGANARLGMTFLAPKPAVVPAAQTVPEIAQVGGVNGLFNAVAVHQQTAVPGIITPAIPAASAILTHPPTHMPLAAWLH